MNHLNIKDTSNEGGYISSLPEAGYVLVFEKDTKYCSIEINGENIRVESNGDPNYLDVHHNDLVNILSIFKKANIYYTLRESCDGNYVYIIITISNEKAENWADELNIDLEIDPIKAIEEGRKDLQFKLAHRTYLDNEEQYITWNEQSFKMLSWEKWEHIHIAFERAIGDVYLKHPPDDKIINHRLHLRILYDILTNDDQIANGANFLVESYCNSKKHPLKYFFALHNEVYRDIQLNLCGYSQWESKVDDIRDYYGEYVAFYFAFLVHYSRWLISFAIIGALLFVYQIYTSKIAVFGSISIIFIGMIWSSLMLEYYYRLENKLIYKWGMMRYKETEVPRPTFHGSFIISPSNGEFIEAYHSKILFFLKSFVSYSTILICISIVISFVFIIWLLKREFEQNTSYSILIGVINGITIQITNALYTKLAYSLNEFEGHRLQQEYYNALVIKRITFIIVNSFNSLFYIAFYDPKYDNNTSDDRLIALRIQLITLFVTAIIIQNTFELLIPKIYIKIRECIEKRKHSHKTHSKYDSDHKHLLLNDDHHKIENINLNKRNIDIDMHMDNNNINIENEILSDIESQMDMAPTISILDNTAEIVILHGYIILFIVIFPLMPLLGVLNNIFEIRIDFYNLTNTQRAIPLSSSGIGVWKVVISIFNLISIFSNMGLIVFRTNIVSDTFNINEEKWLYFFYWSSCMLFVIFQWGIKYLISDISNHLKQNIDRQIICEKYLLLNKIREFARREKNTIQSFSNNSNDAYNQEIKEDFDNDNDQQTFPN